jgi:hypothetical protein
VETECFEAVKPNRPPDAVMKPGHAFWWSEMVMMHVYGHIFKIEVNHDGSFYYIYKNEAHPMWPEVRVMYDKWWYETFESKFLGEE